MWKNVVIAAVIAASGNTVLAESHAANDGADASSDAVEPAQVVDLEAAEAIFRKSCRACHGNKGQGASSYPQINDKEPDYIAEKLERYRAGEKFGPNSILMIQHAKKLSDDDIANLSVYVATAFDE